MKVENRSSNNSFVVDFFVYIAQQKKNEQVEKALYKIRSKLELQFVKVYLNIHSQQLIDVVIKKIA